MGEFISGVMQKQLAGNMPGAEKHLQQSQGGNGSFDNVLQQKTEGQNTNSVGGPNQVQDPKLEKMRIDLMQRYETLPSGMPAATAIFPEYLTTKTRMSEFRNILNKAIGGVEGAPQGTDVQGRFSQVEQEWLKLDGVMRSDKELSQGELLGLQARLYQVSQHIDVLSKVVDQMTSGVKTILNTNV